MAERAARWREVFGVAEFRALWIAQTQSRIGDQLARVALALLVFDRTSSAGLTALMYALTLLPPLLTAPLLSGLARAATRPGGSPSMPSDDDTLRRGARRHGRRARTRGSDGVQGLPAAWAAEP